MIDLDDYTSWDGTAMAAHVRAGDVSPAELEATCRELIERWDPLLGAVADRAEPATGAPDGGEGPLAGVPVAVKELLAVPGLPWTMGSRLMAHNPPGDPSPYVQHLLATGVRVVCSTTSSEFGLLGSTESALRGITQNPWRPGTSAGGSSGGSAALVAAGIVPLAHANDGGGSIRYPAAMTGLFGFKPSNGRNRPSGPDTGGLVSLVVDHVVTRSVRDSAVVLAATEQVGPGAPWTPVGLVEGPGERRLRVGTLTRTLGGAEPDPAVADAVRGAQRLLEALGHTLVDLEPPTVDGAALSEAFFTAAAQTMVEVAGFVAPLLGRPPGPDELEPFTLELIEWGRSLGADARARTERTFASATAAHLAVFDRCDVVLSPTVTRPPWPIGTFAPDLGREELVRRTEDLIGYTPIHNIAGSPGMSVPLAWADGLPVGIHLAAAPGADRTLLELAHELEAAAPWAHRRPDLGAFGTVPACPRS